MENRRRDFLKTTLSGAMLAAAGFAGLKPVLAQGQQGSNPPNRVPPGNSNPLRPPPPLFQPPTLAQLRKNQREITKDVDQLFELAQQLKRQAAASDASQELSVALIEKTQEIEKLAKKIRDLARS